MLFFSAVSIHRNSAASCSSSTAITSTTSATAKTYFYLVLYCISLYSVILFLPCAVLSLAVLCLTSLNLIVYVSFFKKALLATGVEK